MRKVNCFRNQMFHKVSLVVAVMAALAFNQGGFGQKAMADEAICLRVGAQIESMAERIYSKAKEIEGLVEQKFDYAELRKLQKMADQALGDRQISGKAADKVYALSRAAQMTGAIKAIERKLKELKALDRELGDIVKDLRRECE